MWGLSSLKKRWSIRGELMLAFLLKSSILMSHLSVNPFTVQHRHRQSWAVIVSCHSLNFTPKSFRISTFISEIKNLILKRCHSEIECMFVHQATTALLTMSQNQPLVYGQYLSPMWSNLADMPRVITPPKVQNSEKQSLVNIITISSNLSLWLTQTHPHSSKNT